MYNNIIFKPITFNNHLKLVFRIRNTTIKTKEIGE